MRQSLMIQVFRILGFIWAIGVHQVTVAAMYKWVDEDGVTHYTQQPPPDGIKAETLKPPPPVNTDSATEKLENQREQVDKLRGNRQKAAEEKRSADEDKKAKQANCNRARHRLQQANRPRVNITDPDGTHRRASEEERQQTINSATKEVEEYCN